MSTNQVLKYESREKKIAEIKGCLLDEGHMNDVNWMCTVTSEQGNVFFLWNFDWTAVKENVVGLKGTIKVYSWDRQAARYIPVMRDVVIEKSGEWIEQAIGRTAEECIWNDGLYYFSYDLNLELIPTQNEEPESSGEMVLVVAGKKMNFNRECLSADSKFFSKLFASTTESSGEIPIDDVTYDEMKALVDLFQPTPVIPDVSSFPKLLELAERFQMTSVAFLAEFHIMMTDKMSLAEKMIIAEKFKLERLFQKCIESLKSIDEMKEVSKSSEFSDFIKVKMFERMLNI